MRIGVFGAGAIGGYLGIRLSAAGAHVTLLGRASLVAQARRIRAVPRGGSDIAPADDLVVTDDPEALADVDVCLVTVKSAATEQAARTLAEVLNERCIVVSMQNGLTNPRTLQAHLPDRVVAAMISYNVFIDADRRYVQATTGPLTAGTGAPGHVADTMAQLAEAFEAAGQPLHLRDDMESVAAGKLLLNLNNGICAATGLPIADSLRDRDARWCFAACMREGVTILKQTGPAPARVIALPAWAIARLLALPNFVVMRVARRMVDVDPEARSSTLQDVLAGRRTEIDDLNGSIVALAEAAGLRAPANATVTKLVHGLYGREPAPFLTPRGLRVEIERALEAPDSVPRRS